MVSTGMLLRGASRKRHEIRYELINILLKKNEAEQVTMPPVQLHFDPT
jgi:hypothetical protein